MSVYTLIKPGEYRDSVALAQIAQKLTGLPRVQAVSVVMGTEANKTMLEQKGLHSPEQKAASSNDLIIVVKVDSPADGEAVLSAAKNLLRKADEELYFRPRTLRSALKARNGLNLALISVPGRYAVSEAWEALRNGLHVHLFSDNISLEDEAALKQYAVSHNLLMMGPGAGTAIINGAGLGFANVTPRGPVGIVSAAGTGLQEVSILLAEYGVGISQGIGTGGRDLKEEIGGMMMLQGLKALQDDPATKVIVLISKPPSKMVAQRIFRQVSMGKKSTVICMLGVDEITSAVAHNIYPVASLQEAAMLAAHLCGAKVGDIKKTIEEENERLEALAHDLQFSLSAGQVYVRGLFSGGTLCYETQVIWRDMLHGKVYSNVPLEQNPRLKDPHTSMAHSAVDLGEDEFTIGYPHPMLNMHLRTRRILQEAKDSQVAVLMLDVVLGNGAHADPAAELAPAIRQARELAANDGRELLVVLSVTGTRFDPQNRDYQVSALEAAGAIVCRSNAAAARLAAMIVEYR